MNKKAPTDKWTVYIEKELATKCDILFLNPVTGKVSYGYRTKIVNRLVREWLAKMIVEAGKEAVDNSE